MKALRIARYGDTPTIQEIDRPRPDVGDVLVRVAGAAVNPLDLKIAAGYLHEFFPVEFPYTLGTDVSGTIVELGEHVTGWSLGDNIVARVDPSAGGAIAEFAVVPAAQLVHAPESIALSLSSGAATAAATAWQALTEVARVVTDQRVLVHAGAGGVGSFAVQLARKLGAYVITTASGAGLQIASDLGAHEVIDYTVVPFAKQVNEIDVVIDTVGGVVEEQSLAVLRRGGLLVAVPMPPDVDRALARGMTAQFLFHSSDAKRLRTVTRFLDDGLQILLDHNVELADAPQALTYLGGGHAKGKVIVVP